MRVDYIKEDNIAKIVGISVLRDDLFPYFFGGNKARKAQLTFSGLQKQGYDAIVTTGGIQSNHCRVTALASAAKGWKCKLILHGSEHEFMSQKGNALIMRITGAEIEFVTSEEIGPAMDQAMEELTSKGYKPYYLHGGGHNKAGVQAYVNALKELQVLYPNMLPDHIFLASGTGSTQAGIIAGCQEVGWFQTQVHGISVARDKKRGVEAILEALGFVYTEPASLKSNINFYDDYRFGGYGKYDQQLLNFIHDVAEKSGIILDPTYTGKGFFGMMDVVRQKKLSGNILFWHTGGLLNLMA